MFQWPPAKLVSSVSIWLSSTMAGSFMGARNMVASPSCGPPSIFAMMMTKVLSLAPVMNHFLPLIT